MADLDQEKRRPLAPDYIPPSYILDLWRRADRRFARALDEIALCRDIRNGDLSVLRPGSTVQEGERDVLASLLPERRLSEMRLKGVLCRKTPEFDRQPTTLSDQNRRHAKEISSALNEAAQQKVPWRRLMGKKVEDGMHGIVLVPSPADIAPPPDFLSTLDEDGYGKLDDGERRHYTRQRDGSYQGYAARYRRDSRGRPPDDAHYRSGRRRFEVDEHKTRAAYDEEREATLSQNLPLAVRVVSAADGRPILTRGSGDEPFDTQALVIRTRFDAEHLISAGHRWQGMPKDTLVPTGGDDDGGAAYFQRADEGQGLWLYELFALIRCRHCKRRHPVIAYSVDGRDTWQEHPDDPGKTVPDIYDFGKELGIFDWLPARWSWGNTTDDDDPARLPIPFLAPLAQDLLNAEFLRTAALQFVNDNAFEDGLIAKPDTTIDSRAYLETLDGVPDMRAFTLPERGTIKMIPGELQPVPKQQMGRDAVLLMQVFGQSVTDALPSEAMTGGNAQSGRDRVLSREYFEVSQGMILHRALADFAWIGEGMLRLFCAFARQLDEPIPVYADFESPSGEGTSTQKIELSERLIGTNYRIRVRYPEDGLDPIQIDQVANLVDRGHAADEDLLEARGKPATEFELAKITASRVRHSEFGLRMAVANLLRWQGKTEEADVLELQLKEELTPGENRTPRAALAPELQAMLEGGQALPAAPQLGPGDAAAVAGVNGAGMQPPGAQGGPSPIQQSRAGTIGSASDMGQQRQEAQMLRGMQGGY